MSVSLRTPQAGPVAVPTGPVTVGVVGAGQQATANLIPALLQLPHVRVAAVCDAYPDRARAVADSFSVPGSYRSVADLLDAVEPTALVVACPPLAHEQIARQAIAAGVPVFVEKPPAATAAGLRALVELAASRQVVTGVGMNFRYADAYGRIKALLSRPECGTPVSIAIRHLASKPRAPMWSLSLFRSFLLAQAIHPLDLLLDLGGPVRQVHAQRRTGPQDVLLDAQLSFAGGAIGTLLTGTYAPRFDTRVEVVTDSGVLLSLVGLWELTVAGLPSAAGDGQSRAWRQQWHPSPMDAGFGRTGFAGELAAFLDAAASGGEFRPSFADLQPTYDLMDELEQA